MFYSVMFCHILSYSVMLCYILSYSVTLCHILYLTVLKLFYAILQLRQKTSHAI